VALERSLNEIIRRHESLRTTFATGAALATFDGQPAQIIAPYSPQTLPMLDLSELSETEQGNRKDTVRNQENDGIRCPLG